MTKVTLDLITSGSRQQTVGILDSHGLVTLLASSRAVYRYASERQAAPERIRVGLRNTK